MNISFRTRQRLKRTALILLVLALCLSLVGAVWFIWLGRHVIYTRDRGAVLNMSMSDKFAPGKPAQPVETVPVNIYYNEGENAINTAAELTQIVGYYADAEALQNGVGTVLEQVKTLPAATPIMIDVKNAKGAFFYSSSVSSKRDSDIDTATMDELIAYLDDNHMYAIARLPALRDYEYGLHHVSDGLPTSGGYLWADDDYCYWLNPASQGTVTYLISIVTELKALGFDEVVFDNFYFPDTDKIVFNGDKDQAIASAAKTLMTACATDSFAVSFVGQSATFPLPQGRSRLYLDGTSAAQADTLAAQTGLENPAVNLVFLTKIHDTRFNTYSVLRPLDAAH